MKTRQLMVLAITAILVVLPFAQARAQYAYSLGVQVQQVSDFYEPLAPFGYWVQVPRYGWCWYPAYVDAGWRPYTNGNWLWSDAGWYWASEEPWAWATYHYGRWTWDPYYGWLWVPGLEWAPAWVGWRDGDGYVGWAPLPPECDFPPSVNVIYVQQVVIAPQYFVFVERRHFCDLIRPNCVYVNDRAIVNKTANITQIDRGTHGVVNHGPPIDMIERYNPGRVVRARIDRHQPSEVMAPRQQQRGIGQDVRAAPARPAETVGDPRAQRAQQTGYTRGNRSDSQPDTNVQNLTNQRRSNEQQVVVQQMPSPPSRREPSPPPPAVVQNPATVTTDSQPAQPQRGSNGRFGQ